MEDLCALMELRLSLFLRLRNHIFLIQSSHLYSCLSEREDETIISWGRSRTSSTKYIAYREWSRERQLPCAVCIVPAVLSMILGMWYTWYSMFYFTPNWLSLHLLSLKDNDIWFDSAFDGGSEYKKFEKHILKDKGQNFNFLQDDAQCKRIRTIRNARDLYKFSNSLKGNQNTKYL
jgi:hypothetical protein